MAVIRQPAVAGRFYPGNASTLAKDVERYLATRAPPEPALATIVPHAGYMYSGAIAGATFAEVQVPRVAVILCPNHTGMGSRRAIWPEGSWSIPGAELAVDTALAMQLGDRAQLAIDPLAHQREHAIEVQLPFLHARNSQVSIVPICLSEMSEKECLAMGEAMAAVIAPILNQVLLVASTDLSHYVPADKARRLDHLAIERMQALDPEGLYRTVQTHGISMCGYIPATVVLAAARALGARSASLVRYGNSGEISGDNEQVVGYAGMVIRG